MTMFYTKAYAHSDMYMNIVQSDVFKKCCIL